jgi:hypothetical protein
LNSVCTATKRDGSPCKLPSYGSSDLCWAHSPETAERRRRGQSRGGKGKPNRELVRLQGRLEELAEGVLDGSVDRSDAAVAGQLLNYALRAISVGLKAREQEEIIPRLEELEVTLEAKKRSRTWGA